MLAPFEDVMSYFEDGRLHFFNVIAHCTQYRSILCSSSSTRVQKISNKVISFIILVNFELAIALTE